MLRLHHRTTYGWPLCSASSLKPISNATEHSPPAAPTPASAPRQSGRAKYAPIVTGATPHASASCSSAEVRWCDRVTHANAGAPYASAAMRWSSPAQKMGCYPGPAAIRGRRRLGLPVVPSAPRRPPPLCAMGFISGAAEGMRSLNWGTLLRREAQRLLSLSPEHIDAEPPETGCACMRVPRSPPLSTPPDSYRGLEPLFAALPS